MEALHTQNLRLLSAHRKQHGMQGLPHTPNGSLTKMSGADDWSNLHDKVTQSVCQQTGMRVILLPDVLFVPGCSRLVH